MPHLFYLFIGDCCLSFVLKVKMADSKDKIIVNSIHSDPNFSVVCSFLVRYGHLLGFENISFEDLEKWIDDTRYGL